HMHFFFSSRRRHTRSKRDWSSDVCSSDLAGLAASACQNNTVANGTGTLPPPKNLSYELDPSGDAVQPAGIRLAWDDLQSSDLARSEERRVGEEGRWRWWRGRGWRQSCLAV